LLFFSTIPAEGNQADSCNNSVTTVHACQNEGVESCSCSNDNDSYLKHLIDSGPAGRIGIPLHG